MAEGDEARCTLRTLLAVTPQPPVGASPEVLIGEGADMLRERETELAILELLLAGSPTLFQGDGESRAVMDELALRDARWTNALRWAHQELSKRRLAAQRARQSQRAYQSAR